jgi:alanine racemase
MEGSGKSQETRSTDTDPAAIAAGVTHYPLRLIVDRAALAANWRWLAATANTACGAAIKADGYGLGARETLDVLAAAGCRDFFVSTWAEAEALGAMPEGASLSVLHGVGPDDVDAALASDARPVLNTAEQVARWRQIAEHRTCDVMVDTGMNRLGLRVDEIRLLDGLEIDTCMSHLACADEDHQLNRTQLSRFFDVRDAVTAQRYSLANSAGICLGRDYAFDLVRPGLALYGGIPRDNAEGHIAQVAHLEAQVVQRRTIRAGESCGYGATFTADRHTEAAVVNIGYADGYWRGFSNAGGASAGGVELPVLGRVSMDLVILGCDKAKDLREGDWVEMDYDLRKASAASGMSQYELLTGLGDRFERIWR